MRIVRCQRGQATVEYVAILAVLALLVPVGAVAGSERANGVANAVLEQFRRALCIVSGRACTVQRQRPCTIASRRESRRFAVNVLLVRISADRYLLREELSDGTFRLTVAQRGGAGAEAGVGARAHLTVGGRRIGVADEARGAADAAFTYGEVFVARDAEEADRIQKQIKRGFGSSGDLEPREIFVDGAMRWLGRAGIGSSILGAQLEAFRDNVLGGRRDRRSGALTVSFTAGESAWGLTTIALGGPAGTGDGQVGFALTLDRGGRPTELQLHATGTLAAGSTPPPGLARPLGIGSDGVTRVDGRRWELTARLDLTDPDVAAAWAAFRRAPASGAAIRGLGEAIRTRAALDVRAYRVSTSADGAALGLGAGPRLGGEYDHAIDVANLVAASSRPAGGLWEQRTDCLER